MLCTLRAVQHIKILSSAEVFTAASGKVIFQAKKGHREFYLRDSVGFVGERQHGGYHGYDGIQASFKLWDAVRPLQQCANCPRMD